MSSIAAGTPSFRISPHARPALVRMVWKEYRMLRGFWVGIAALALLQMAALAWWLPAGVAPVWVLGAAWAWAAMYAVGAAVTAFAAEREEETHRFLQLLPRCTVALLVGKVALAAVSAATLAVLLALAAGAMTGGWPDAQVTRATMLQGSMCVAEALAWGVLASLLMSQPLLAAVLAMGAASLGVQLAITATGGGHAGLTWSSYGDALPVRAAIVLLVAAANVWLGRRWLHGSSGRSLFAWRLPSRRQVDALSRTWQSEAGRGPWRRMFTRLWWQSWREGWGVIALAVPLGALLMFGGELIRSLAAPQLDWPWTALFVPALLGALAFRADQRGRHYRFLAERSASPTLVWLARQATWVVPVVLLGAAIQIAVILKLLNSVTRHELEISRAIVVDTYVPLALAWSAALAAYGVGQLCSMLIRREVLAGFVALLASVVILLWAYVAWAWELPARWFVTPIALGALAATWLRCGAWLAERKSWRTWLPAAIVAAGPVGAIAFGLPAARLAQLDIPHGPRAYLREPLDTTLARWRDEAPAAKQVALAYEQSAAHLVPWGHNASQWRQTTELGRQVDAMWKRQIASPAYQNVLEMGGEMGMGSEMGMGAVAELAPADRALAKRAEAALATMYLEANQPTFDRWAEISQAPRCWFANDGATPARTRMDWLVTSWIGDLKADAARLSRSNNIDGALDTALRRIATMWRMRAHLAQYQTLETYANRMHGASQHDLALFDSNYDQRDASGLVLWATAEGQTSKRIRRAIVELRKCDAMFPDPREGVVAQYLQTRDVVEGQRPPWFFDKRSGDSSWRYRLAYIANELPWERRRGLKALGLLTEVQLDIVDAITHGLQPAHASPSTPGAAAFNGKQIRRLLRQWQSESALDGLPLDTRLYAADSAAARQIDTLVRRCNTSYLAVWGAPRVNVHLPMGLRIALDQQAQRRGEILRLALIAYRLDHGAYPERLSQLSPKYLAAKVKEYRRNADHAFAVPPEGEPSEAFLKSVAGFQRVYQSPLPDPYTGEDFPYRANGFNAPVMREPATLKGSIAADTALLWSVGVDDAIPTDVDESVWLDDEGRQVEAGGEGALQMKTIAVIRFRGGESWVWPIVLPLPRGEKQQEP